MIRNHILNGYNQIYDVNLTVRMITMVAAEVLVIGPYSY